MVVVLPLSGYNLFMGGTAWINGTAIMAFTPWLWWCMWRYTEGKTRIIVVIPRVEHRDEGDVSGGAHRLDGDRAQQAPMRRSGNSRLSSRQ